MAFSAVLSVLLLCAASLMMVSDAQSSFFNGSVTEKEFPLSVFSLDAPSPFLFGAAIGARYGDRIHDYIHLAEGVESLLQYCKTDVGSALLDKLIDINSVAFPEYTKEIQGMAAGLNQDVTLRDLYCLSFGDELYLMNRRVEDRSQFGWNKKNQTRCSDIQLRHGPNSMIMGHNEDDALASKYFGYILNARLQYQKQKECHVFSFTYPGQLMGYAFAWKPSTGMVFTVNELFPATASPGKGCFYILRDSLRANSIDEVIALVNVTNSASGFSLNVMSISEGRIINVEVGPGDHNLAVYELKGDTHWNDHFNNYKNLDTEQYVDKSSLFRSKRVQELSPPVSEHDILEILGDTHNPYYPIYRDGRAPDTGCYTLATAVFNGASGEGRIYTENPKNSSPFLVFPLLEQQ